MTLSSKVQWKVKDEVPVHSWAATMRASWGSCCGSSNVSRAFLLCRTDRVDWSSGTWSEGPYRFWLCRQGTLKVASLGVELASLTVWLPDSHTVRQQCRQILGKLTLSLVISLHLFFTSEFVCLLGWVVTCFVHGTPALLTELMGIPANKLFWLLVSTWSPHL